MEAGRMLRHYNVRSLVVTRDDGRYLGLVTTRMIAERYISATDLLEQGGATPMAVAADLIESLEQKVSEITETDVLVLDKEGLLGDAIEDLMASSLREAVVLDDAGFCIGIVTRTDVATRPKRKVVLVDHNETRQAAHGIEEAEVVEIIDHHRIADVMTANPIQFINLPVGSTATIVTMEYRKCCVDVTPAMAQVLLSAIMTDTVILKSPTTTEEDRRQAAYLASVAGVDVVEFGLAVFRCRGGEGDLPVEKLVGADAKEFQLGDAAVLIAQHETVDLAGVLLREQEIREHMRMLRETHGYEFVLLMVTDIMAEGSQFLCEGNRRAVNRIFGINCTGEGGTWMPGVLSRKKQVAALILGA
ncbi:MAG: putative manganese-dependent inorganic diphosphatase, partial [Eggerthellaceae bacterium]|nr:putative manganese-dependent inorganic diphosphatase [Eggerthellaceae bacterium]